jgi:hypothetical protein
MTRSVLTRFRVPPDVDFGPVSVEVRVGTVDGPVSTRVGVAGRGPVLDEPIIYRVAASPKSPFVPAALGEFRRTERLRLEWRLAAAIESPQARLLGRNGMPIAVPVSVTEFDRDGRRLLAADLALSPLGAGEYFVEVTAASGGRTDRKLFPFRPR